MIKSLVSIYLPSYPKVMVYMLQASEYQTIPYLKWVWRTQDFSAVNKRRQLEHTRAANLLLLGLSIGILAQILSGIWLIYQGQQTDMAASTAFGIALILCYPFVWAHLAILPLELGRLFISRPSQLRQIRASAKVFAAHPGKKIAVVGSYGKTTMKELLGTVLKQGLKVAVTPANKNVSVSHAKFAQSLEGDEDVLIIEYGEGAPGDVARFAKLTTPTHAVITGVAPAHLDRYKTLGAAARDIFSVAEYVNPQNVYVNKEFVNSDRYIKKDFAVFDAAHALGWQITNTKTSLSGTEFTLKKGKKSLKLKSKLIGKHQVVYLAFVAALAIDLGLTVKQVKDGIVKTEPFEHRMQPYRLAGAWIIDDTYNGNIEGIKAGTQLLKDLPGKRKIYVTPGLVDQGPETKAVHTEIGHLIAAANPDLVVLMRNSVTRIIEEGLNAAGYYGKIHIEDQPLNFYQNLSHFVANGDLVVMQNDWTDNYA